MLQVKTPEEVLALIRKEFSPLPGRTERVPAAAALGRLLADYLCRREGLDPESICGYDREETTHNAVAVQIAAGSADAGMGICSAAKLYGLDFLPVCVEEYDLLISEKLWNSAPVRALIRTLKSPEFRERLEALGGYTLERPGEIIEL